MTVRIDSDQKLPPGAAFWIEQRARLAFGRYAPAVRQVRIQLRWLTAKTGTVVVSCHGSRGIVAEVTGSDPLGTINDVLDRASRQLDRKLRLARALAEAEARSNL